MPLSKEAQSASHLARLTRQQELSIYARDMQLAGQSIHDGKYVDAERALLNWVPKDGQTDLRGFEWYYQWERCHDRSIVRTIKHPISVYDLSFLSGAEHIAIGWFHTLADVWDLEQSDRQSPGVRLPGHGGGTSALVAMPERSQVATATRTGKLWLWSTESGERIGDFSLGFPASTNLIKSLDVTQDGRYLAAGAGDSGASSGAPSRVGHTAKRRLPVRR